MIVTGVLSPAHPPSFVHLPQQFCACSPRLVGAGTAGTFGCVAVAVAGQLGPGPHPLESPAERAIRTAEDMAAIMPVTLSKVPIEWNPVPSAAPWAHEVRHWPTQKAICMVICVL